MTHHPDRDELPATAPDDEPSPEVDAPETENIKDEGEPLGANLA